MNDDKSGEGRTGDVYVGPNYCSMGWTLYNRVAEMWSNFDKVWKPGVRSPETLTAEQAVNEANDKVNYHLDTCPQCYAEECRIKESFGHKDIIH